MRQRDGNKSASGLSAQEPQRLMSLDALRGFDMMWIVGGAEAARAVAFAVDRSLGETVVRLTEHPQWNGYTPWDQIFPMFMFIAGVAIPYSLAAHRRRGAGAKALYGRVIRRGVMLVLLGMIFNGLLLFDFAHTRYPSVLGRIGVAYLLAALIAMNTRVRGQIVALLALLAGYWAALKFVPVPGFGAGDWTPGHTLPDYVDRLLIPGVLYEKVRDPEGLLSTVSSVSTVLGGVLAGHWLRSDRSGGYGKAIGLAAAGALAVVLGKLWDPWFPINKNLWTGSFVLFTCGWSALLLAAFYLVIDVWHQRRWCFPFVVLGMNAITIYMMVEFVDFAGIFDTVFARAHDKVHEAFFACGDLVLGWLVLYWMYRQKWFLRV